RSMSCTVRASVRVRTALRYFWHGRALVCPTCGCPRRELLESMVAATVTSMHCHEPEACRVVLDWAQLLLCTTAFVRAPAATAQPPWLSIQVLGNRGGPTGVGAGSRIGGGGSSATGTSAGFAALQARCSQEPALERAYA
ncbi:hypothetical protein Vretifemale_5247, partial [Volvox reticuliferus]